MVGFALFNGILAAGIVAAFTGLVTTTYRTLSAERRASARATRVEVREATGRAA